MVVCDGFIDDGGGVCDVAGGDGCRGGGGVVVVVVMVVVAVVLHSIMTPMICGPLRPSRREALDPGLSSHVNHILSMTIDFCAFTSPHTLWYT